MDNRIITFSNEPVKLANDNTISGLGLVWFDGSEGTRRQFDHNAFEALAPNAEVVFFRNDVIAAFNHDFSQVLGRQSNNTLKITKVGNGIQYSIELNPDDPQHQSIKAKINRGDIRGSSATFQPLAHKWAKHNGEEVLLYTKIELIEIGPVTIPAMEKSTAIAASEFEKSEYQNAAFQTKMRFDQLDI